MTTRSLDLGCGSQARNPFNADEVWGVDLRGDLGGGVKTADLVIEPIPFDDASFDYVTAYDLLQFIPALVYAPQRRNAFVALMGEIGRVLKPGGMFLSFTPAFPHATAFRDPANVSVITEETFPLYFDDQHRWASIYGFQAAFHMRLHEVRGQHVFAVMQSVPVLLPRPRISVMIPVYNGAKYLARTLDSALQQTFTDFEILCVDDCSTDNSLDLLNAYAARDARVRVFGTGTNRGTAPKALNHALAHLRGEYFAYSSQDDLFSVDWLEKMHARAVETGADAVIPDLVFYHENEPSRNRVLSGLGGDRSVQLTGREAALHSLDWTIPNNALLRAELVQRLRFEEFAMNSDEYSGRVFYLNCNKVVFSGGQFLYRQDNELAVTKKITYKTFDIPYTFFRLHTLLKENGFPAEVCAREGVKAIRALVGLQQWLVENRSVLPAHEIQEAEQRAQRAHQCLLEHKVYDLLA